MEEAPRQGVQLQNDCNILCEDGMSKRLLLLKPIRLE